MADVLVVDDVPAVAAVTSAVLSAVGHRVGVVDSGAGALARLRERPADLMVLDLDMPGMDGWEVLRRVRADPRLAAMPVVVYSANSQPPPSGAPDPDRIVAKGAPISELVNAVAQLA